jgi:Sperm-tail PG-rich repeat
VNSLVLSFFGIMVQLGQRRHDPLLVSLSTKAKLPKWSFGQRIRTAPSNLDIPGPGQYNIGSSFGSNSRITMKAKLSTWVKSDGPGPGAYKVERPRSAGPSFGVGDRKDGFYPGRDSPGPGAYTVGSEWSPANDLFKGRKRIYSGASFGVGDRSPLSRNDRDIPGPGSYAFKSTTRIPAPSFGIGDRPPLGRYNDTPGPGSVSVKSTLGADSLKFSIGRRVDRQQRNPDLTGPGSYNLKSTVGEGLKFSLGRKIKEQRPQSADVMLGPFTQFGY